MDIKELLKVSKIRKLKFSPIDMEQVDTGGGVYRMYDKSKQVIYVGKSQNLHRRLLQHIGKDTNTAYFIDEVKKIEWFKNDDPVLQTLLEGIFIAYHTPKYNDEVKDREKLQE
jgi:excinuclease ABC subunit C